MISVSNMLSGNLCILLGPLLLQLTLVCSESSRNKLLLVLLDGMRHDATTKDIQGFNMMRDAGVYAEGLRPTFPSVSFTNYHSITTGLYPESHGMIGNDMYDFATNRSFFMNCYPECEESLDPFWWSVGEPIWVTASAQGKRIRAVRWCGCDVNIREFKTSPEVCLPYSSDMSIDDFHGDIENVLNDFAEDLLDFAAVYQEEPDSIQHKNGVESVKAKEMISQLIRGVQFLQERTDALTMAYDNSTKLSDVLDIMIVSDHGHMNISEANAVNVRSPIIKREDTIHMLRTGAVLHIWPKENKEDEIYSSLSRVSNAQVFRRQEIPERWHFKNSDRQAPLVAVADPGYYLSTDTYPGPPTLKSTHGYDNAHPNMSGVFLARGPHFKKSYQVQQIENVELYQIMCAILGITPNPHNGSWSLVENMVLDLETPVSQFEPLSTAVIVVICISVAVIALIAVALGYTLFRRKYR